MVLSIVIPVYNVEKYVGRCLQSCLDQGVSFNDYEIIVVNDGSKDNSLSIIQGKASCSTNIIVINQENQGLSAARNTGLYSARGEYVWFVDSDDYIEENCLKKLFNKLDGVIDILQIQHRYVYDDSSLNQDMPIYHIDGVKSGKDVFINGGLLTPVPFSIYRTSFLKKNKLEFYRGIFHEDIEFTPRANYLAQNVASFDEICYNYLQKRSGSITNNLKLKNERDLLFVNNRLLDFFIDAEPDVKIVVYQKVSTNINTILNSILKQNNNDKREFIYLLKKNKHMFNYMKKTNRKKYILEGCLLGVDVNLGVFVYSCFHRFLK